MLTYVISMIYIPEPKSRFTRYPSWNTKMYPLWKDEDPRYKDSWKGMHNYPLSQYNVCTLMVTGISM